MSKQHLKVRKGVEFTPQNSAPSDPDNGDLYFDSTLGLRLRRSGVWQSAGGAGGAIKINLYDPVSTSLPSGVSAIIDNQTVVNGDRVLFSNLTSGAKKIYEVSGVGASIVWTAQNMYFEGSDLPADGDMVIIERGDTFADQVATYDGTSFKINDIVRFYNGANGTDYWELGSLKTSSLVNDTSSGLVFSVAYAGSQNIIVDFSIISGTNKEVGQIFLTTDGTNASCTVTSTELSSTGVTFSADIIGSNLRLLYTTTNTGASATLKYFLKRWSDSAGGPAGVPNYSGYSGNVANAAGNTDEIQYKGSGGSLDANSQFKWETSSSSLYLNGLRKYPLTQANLADNTGTVTTFYAVPHATNRSIVMLYSIERNGERQTGRILISNNSTIASLSEAYIDTASLGIVISAAISGANVVLQYTSTNTGFGATFKYTTENWT